MAIAVEVGLLSLITDIVVLHLKDKLHGLKRHPTNVEPAKAEMAVVDIGVYIIQTELMKDVVPILMDGDIHVDIALNIMA